MKLFKCLVAAAVVLAVSATAYAETQSVKVSGDLTMRGFARGAYTLDKNARDVTGLPGEGNWQTFLTSTAEVQIDAELTDNVSGVIRLVNERLWGEDGRDLFTDDSVRNANAVEFDLAYIELKEMLYSPLTLRIGRQDLWFGRGFIIGNSLREPNDPRFPREYTALNSFDAIRATLDYDPWTIDAVYAKIEENNVKANDDIDLWGVNIGYLFDAYNAEAEGYWFWKSERNPAQRRTDNSVHTMGLRGSFDPIEDWTVALEGAFQTGKYAVDNQIGNRSRAAWALDAMVECRAFQDDYAWRPVLAAEWIWYSGDNEYSEDPTDSSRFKGWDPMFRGKFDTAIREFQNWMYDTVAPSTPSYTNQHQVLVSGSIEPTDSLMLKAVYANFFTDRKGVNPNATKRHIGQEVDVQLTWDYTEDVQFGLLSAWFFPGRHLKDAAAAEGDSTNTATSIVGTVSLSF